MIFDILLIAFLGFFAWRGKRRGLVAGVLSFFSVIISYISSAVFSRPIFEEVKKTDYYEEFLKKAEELIPKNSTLPERGMLGSIVSESHDIMANQLAEKLGFIIVSVAVFILSLILLKFLIKLLNSVLKLPGLNFLNKTGGLILGTVTAFLLVYVVLAVWGAVTMFEMPKALETSYLLKSMFENNLLFLVL